MKSKSILILPRWTQLRFIRLAVITSATLLSATSAVAQIQNFGPVTIAHGAYFNDMSNNPLPGTFTHVNLTGTNNSAGNTVDLKLTGDWDYMLQQQAGTGNVYTTAVLPFSVGNVPVQVSNDLLATNAKWVNGGGGATAPTTASGLGEFAFLEPVGAPSAFYTTPLGNVPPMVQTGNGYTIFQPPATVIWPYGLSSYVLPANTQWEIYLAIFTTIDDSAFIAGFPPITVSNEFGGALGDSFSGFRDSFSWQAVPEPSSSALLAIAACALFFCRRRKSRGRGATHSNLTR